MPTSLGQAAHGPNRARLARPRLSLALAVLAAVILGCGGGEPNADASLSELVEPGAASGFNVLLVTLDTVRADRVGCYGHSGAETPVCDALASRGVRFDDAVTSVPLTLPAHATILTGLTPRNHGARENGKYRLAEGHWTLAEELASHGYETGAFVGCFVLDESFGLDQGFDTYDFEVGEGGYRRDMPDFNERQADAVTDSAIEWLNGVASSGSSSPFFMWVHYFDPHLPYRSPYQRLPRFASRPYDAEIAFADYSLGRLVDRLEEVDLMANTLVVLVADHGEALGEHGESTHGLLLYEGTMRVPFIISNAALFGDAHVVSDRVVGLVDVRATIEDLLGLTPDGAGDGRSLIAEPLSGDRTIYIETEMPLSLAGWSPLYGLRSHRYKYVLAPERELYDLASDPAECRNLFTSGSSVGDSLAAALTGVMSGEYVASGSGRPMSDAEVERLGALGYVMAPERARGDSRPDPKEMMGVHADAVRSEQLYAMGKYEEAAALAEEVLAASPEFTLPLRVLAFSYLRTGRPSDAVELLRESAERVPDTYLVRSLAKVLILEGRYEEAEEALATYSLLDPLDGRVPLLLGDIRSGQGRPEQALGLYRRALELDENRVGVDARGRIADMEARPGE